MTRMTYAGPLEPELDTDGDYFDVSVRDMDPDEAHRFLSALAKAETDHDEEYFDFSLIEDPDLQAGGLGMTPEESWERYRDDLQDTVPPGFWERMDSRFSKMKTLPEPDDDLDPDWGNTFDEHR